MQAGPFGLIMASQEIPLFLGSLSHFYCFVGPTIRERKSKKFLQSVCNLVFLIHRRMKIPTRSCSVMQFFQAVGGRDRTSTGQFRWTWHQGTIETLLDMMTAMLKTFPHSWKRLRTTSGIKRGGNSKDSHIWVGVAIGLP